MTRKNRHILSLLNKVAKSTKLKFQYYKCDSDIYETPSEDELEKYLEDGCLTVVLDKDECYEKDDYIHVSLCIISPFPNSNDSFSFSISHKEETDEEIIKELKKYISNVLCEYRDYMLED